jgi:putative glutamine amidotransferase
LLPLIGVTTALHTRPDNGRRYHQVYAPNAFAVERAGGLPILIPAGLDAATLRALYDRLDGVLIPGGGDINPARYNATAHPLTAGIDDARDALEISVAQWAAADDRPLLGICRGHQLVHVALGGALIQDIASQVTTTIQHDNPVDRPRDLIHPVSIEAGSRLASVVGSTGCTVNSLHHQAVARPAPDLRVTAHAPDGVVEASELPDHRFFLAVQWHPEDLAADPAMLRLFEGLVEAARERAAARYAGA